jgi:hypothetical protein
MSSYGWAVSIPTHLVGSVPARVVRIVSENGIVFYPAEDGEGTSVHRAGKSGIMIYIPASVVKQLAWTERTKLRVRNGSDGSLIVEPDKAYVRAPRGGEE